jgi:hypothetical protein
MLRLRRVLSGRLSLLYRGPLDCVAGVKLILPRTCIALVFSLTALGIAHAFGDGGNAARCLENTRISFNAARATIELGQSTTLSWSIRPPPTCNRVTLDGFSYGQHLNGPTYGLAGSTVVQPWATTTYSLLLNLPGGDFRRLGPVQVTVNLPNPVYYINGNTLEWKQLLWGALGEGNKRVVIAPSVDMDLSGYQDIQIAGNTLLTSELPPVAHTALEFGPGDSIARPLARDAPSRTAPFHHNASETAFRDHRRQREDRGVSSPRA